MSFRHSGSGLIRTRSASLLAATAIGVVMASPAAAVDCRTAPAPAPGTTVTCTVPANPPAFYDAPVEFTGTDDVTIILDTSADIDLDTNTPNNTAALLNSGVDPTAINNGTIAINAPGTTGIRAIEAVIGTGSTFGLARNTGTITINADNVTAVQAGTASSTITGLTGIEARNDGGTITLDSGGQIFRMNGLLAFGDADFVGAANQGTLIVRTAISDAVEALNSNSTGEADAFNARTGIIDFSAIDGRVLRAQAEGDAFGLNNGSIIVRNIANNVVAISVVGDNMASGTNDGRIEFQSNASGGFRAAINANGGTSAIVRNTMDGEILATGTGGLVGIRAISNQLIQVINEGVIDLDGLGNTGVEIRSGNGTGNIAVFQNTGTIDVANAAGTPGYGALFDLQGTRLSIENGGLIQAGGAGDDGQAMVISQTSNGVANLVGNVINANGGVIRGDFALNVVTAVDGFVIQNDGLIESLGTDMTDYALSLRSAGGFQIANTGTINGLVRLSDVQGDTTFFNSGTIDGDMLFDDMPGVLQLTNSGTITHNVELGSGFTGLLEFDHSGTLDGDLSGSSQSRTILTTSGTIDGDIRLGALADRITINDGAVFGGAIDGGGGIDALVFDVSSYTATGTYNAFEDIQIVAGDVVFDEVSFLPSQNLLALSVLGGSSLTVSGGQSVVGGDTLISGTFDIATDGELIAGGRGVLVDASGQFTNAGTLTGNAFLAGLSENSGRITGTVTIDGTTFENSGIIDGDIDSSSAASGFTFANSGTVTGSFIGSGLDDVILLTDGSDIQGSINGGAGTDRLDIDAASFALGGQMTDVEAINILGGTTTINGFQHSLASGTAALSLDQGAILLIEGTGGQFGGSLDAEGDVSIALDSALALTGDLVVANGSTLSFGLDETSNGVISAANADLQSGSALSIDVATNATNLSSGSEFDIITVSGTITDAADALLADNSALFDFTRRVVTTSSGEALRVTIARSIQLADLIDPTNNPGQVASGLDGLIDDPGSAGVAISTALGQLATLGELAEAVEQISPGDSGGPAIAAFELAEQVRQSIGHRTRNDLDKGVSLWSSGGFGSRNVDADSDVDALDLDISSFAFGADVSLSSAFRAGIGYSFASGDYVETGAGINRNADFDGGMFFAYADFALGERARISLIAGAGSLDTEASRAIAVLNQTATARIDTDVTYLRGEFAFDIPLGSGWSLAPSAAANLVWAQIDGFEEAGSDAAIRFGDRNVNRNTLQAGLALGRSPEERTKSGFFPFVSATTFTQLGSSNDRVAASFVGGGDPFSLRMNELDTNGVQLGAGANWIISPHFRIGASIEQEFLSGGDALRGAISGSIAF